MWKGCPGCVRGKERGERNRKRRRREGDGDEGGLMRRKKRSDGSGGGLLWVREEVFQGEVGG